MNNNTNLIIEILNFFLQICNLIFLSQTHPEISIILSLISIAVAAAGAAAAAAADAGAVAAGAVAAGAVAGVAAGGVVAAAGAAAAGVVAVAVIIDYFGEKNLLKINKKKKAIKEKRKE